MVCVETGPTLALESIISSTLQRDLLFGHSGQYWAVAEVDVQNLSEEISCLYKWFAIGTLTVYLLTP